MPMMENRAVVESDPIMSGTVPAVPAEGGQQGSARHVPKLPKEIGGPSGPEPTRYGDWERNGRCSDF
jgi:hypothetical protein